MEEAAFPVVRSVSDSPDGHYVTSVWSEGGLSKREYFAAKALQGLATKVRIDGRNNPTFQREVARDAIYLADALLEELAKKDDD